MIILTDIKVYVIWYTYMLLFFISINKKNK